MFERTSARLPVCQQPRCTLDRTPLVQLVRRSHGSGNGSISEMNTVGLIFQQPQDFSTTKKLSPEKAESGMSPGFRMLPFRVVRAFFERAVENPSVTIHTGIGADALAPVRLLKVINHRD